MDVTVWSVLLGLVFFMGGFVLGFSILSYLNTAKKNSLAPELHDFKPGSVVVINGRKFECHEISSSRNPSISNSGFDIEMKLISCSD